MPIQNKPENKSSPMPPSWAATPLCDIAEINPRLDRSDLSDELEVSFVPMPAVEAGTGAVDVSAPRTFGEVRKGYTAFREGDVLFAKITPCMENGKMAVAPALRNGLGFGSTEFHVLRPRKGVDAKYLYYFVSSEQFRHDAEHNMTGAVGQRRVPTNWLSSQPMHFPPTPEQKRIVAKIEELFSELDKGVESLKTAREQLKVYRQAVLKHAFEGKLTAHWREENPHLLESPSQIVARLNKERAADTTSKSNKLQLPRLCDDSDLPKLPEGWAWVGYGGLCQRIRNGISEKPKGDSGAPIFRISAVRPMELVMDDVRFIDDRNGRYDDYRLERGDLLFTRYNGSRAYVGVCAEYQGDGGHLFPDKLIQTRLAVGSVLPAYLEAALACGSSRSFIERRIRTTAGQSGVSGADIRSIPVPLCHPDEQALIVKAVRQALDGASRIGEEIERALRRADVLRQSILKRAFSGQLVPQDPNDEPASALLERIRAEKASPTGKPKRRRASDPA